MSLSKHNAERPGQILNRLKSSFARAQTQERKESLIRRLAVVERRIVKVLNLFSKQPASSLIH
jgi:hypothetical protein